MKTVQKTCLAIACLVFTGLSAEPNLGMDWTTYPKPGSQNVWTPKKTTPRNLAEEVKRGLNLVSLELPSAHYGWTPPREVGISNETYQVVRCYSAKVGRYGFELKNTAGQAIARCQLAVHENSRQAVDGLCDSLIRTTTMPTDAVIRSCRVSRDSQGNVIIERKGKGDGDGDGAVPGGWFLRTYGNVSLKVLMYNRSNGASAKSIAEAILKCRVQK